MVRPRIVLSGVNITAMGALAVFGDALESLAAEYSSRYDIVALVNSKSLFDIPGVTFIEYPAIKSSRLKRLRFEYWDCRAISRNLNAHLWLAMHDITPSAQAEVKAVYCQNAVACHPFRWQEAMHDAKFAAFTLLYRYLYRINIRSNDFVIVQQDWFREVFQSRYGVRNVVVAHPSMDHHSLPDASIASQPHSYRFFYPSYPWNQYKNFELLLSAARALEREGFTKFEIWLTVDGTETSYAAKLIREYADLTTVRWLGLLPRDEVMRRYTEADCLLFPSKLESWGMPLTEFCATGKAVLAADLPYAHETVGQYGQAAFFDPDNVSQLALLMRQAADGKHVFTSVEELHIAPPFSRNWQELWKILLTQPGGSL
jgi:glycosyltransferase involved in cell wall biosynthesis